MIDLAVLRRVGETFGFPEHRAFIAEAADEIEQLRAAQWPEEATAEMHDAIYALNLGTNQLSGEDVIDIYDTLRRIVQQKAESK